MNLLFIQGGSRLKQSEDGRWWTDPNFTSEIWERYMSICDHLTVVLRREKQLYQLDDALKRFNPVPNVEKLQIVPLEDILFPKYGILNPFKRSSIINKLKQEVLQSDKVIIRSCSFYTIECAKLCIEYNKPYLFEVTGFALEGLTHHSLLGKLSAGYFEKWTKRLAKHSDAAIYVTEEALQKRYPASNMLGCSDVEILSTDEIILSKRMAFIKDRKNRKILRIGTAAFLDVKWKGQSIVIEALYELKKRGIDYIHYDLVGMGTGFYIRSLVDKYGLQEQVHFVGAKPHSEIFDWLDTLDIYVQPSYQEGLCRIIAEAISRACPVICSNTGGNYELIDSRYIFPCGDYESLSVLLVDMEKDLEFQAIKNFNHSKKYDKQLLDKKRIDFLTAFVNR